MEGGHRFGRLGSQRLLDLGQCRPLPFLIQDGSDLVTHVRDGHKRTEDGGCIQILEDVEEGTRAKEKGHKSSEKTRHCHNIKTQFNREWLQEGLGEVVDVGHEVVRLDGH